MWVNHFPLWTPWHNQTSSTQNSLSARQLFIWCKLLWKQARKQTSAFEGPCHSFVPACHSHRLGYEWAVVLQAPCLAVLLHIFSQTLGYYNKKSYTEQAKLFQLPPPPPAAVLQGALCWRAAGFLGYMMWAAHWNKPLVHVEPRVPLTSLATSAKAPQPCCPCSLGPAPAIPLPHHTFYISVLYFLDFDVFLGWLCIAFILHLWKAGRRGVWTHEGWRGLWSWCSTYLMVGNWVSERLQVLASSSPTSMPPMNA